MSLLADTDLTMVREDERKARSKHCEGELKWLLKIQTGRTHAFAT